MTSEGLQEMFDVTSGVNILNYSQILHPGKASHSRKFT
jgi:hypothetical protein